MNYFNMQSYG